MEFTFYHIVVIVATIVLILVLTLVGISFNKSREVSFPPTKNTCPDYWVANYDDPKNPTCKINDLNIGTITKTDGDYNMSSKMGGNAAFTPGYDDVNKTVNFADAAWSTSFSTSGQCALKKWANKYEISWDGVSNFNNC